MVCHPLFELSQWADVRVSRGERGGFLFIANYLDDPIATTIRYDGDTLFGGHPVNLPARRGLILPLDWQVTDGVTLHYATGEVAEVTSSDTGITLRLVPDEFTAELTLNGFRCENATDRSKRPRPRDPRQSAGQ
jgi:beta-galactosidase